MSSVPFAVTPMEAAIEPDPASASVEPELIVVEPDREQPVSERAPPARGDRQERVDRG